MIIRLSELLEGALAGAGLEGTSVIWRIAESWAEVVGPRVATRAAPTRLRRGELTIAAPDAVWRQELTLLGPEIAAKVNQKIGKNVVERVRLVAGVLDQHLDRRIGPEYVASREEPVGDAAQRVDVAPRIGRLDAAGGQLGRRVGRSPAP